MRTLTLSLLTLLLAAGVCHAQYPYGGYGGGYGGYGNIGPAGSLYSGYGGYSPGYRSPVSPYLNLVNNGNGNNNGNSAINYYNFVRPFTTGSANRAFGTGMGGVGNYNGIVGNYFPTLNQLDDDFKTQTRSPEKDWRVTDTATLIPVQMAPTGHQAGFANTLGYFGPMMATQGGTGSRGQGTQQQPSQQRR
jgi:hypothetical protein